MFVIIALGSQADQPRLTGQLQTKGRPCLRKQGGWLLRWTTGFHMKILPYVHMYLHTHLVNIHKMETLTFLRKAFPWRNKGRLSSVLEQKTCLVNLMKLARAILRVESLCVCLEWILGFVWTHWSWVKSYTQDFKVVFVWYLHLTFTPWTWFKLLPSTQCHCLPSKKEERASAYAVNKTSEVSELSLVLA